MYLLVQFCLEGSVLFQDLRGISGTLGVQLGSQCIVRHGNDLGSQQSGVDTAVDGDRGHRDAGGHHHGGKQGVHAVQHSTLAGHTDDSIGVLDERSHTLISGDGLQGAGVDKYRCSLYNKNAYIETIEKIKNDKSNNLF